MSIKELARGLFDSIGSDRVNQTEVAFYCVLFSSPFPFIWVLSLYLMSHSHAHTALNLDYVTLYYQCAPFMSASYLLLAFLGWRLRKQERHSDFYVHAAIQCIALNTFIMCAFFGFFTTPVSLSVIAAIGIGSFVFDRAKIWGGLISLSLLCLATAFLHLQGLPPVPIAKSLSDFEGLLLPWTSTMFLGVSAFFIAVFAFFTAYLMENSREKQALLESLSGKLARYLSPQVYASIFKGEKEVKIETYRKKLTVFFSDIKSFTEITEGMESESLSTLLNNYLNEMSVIALKHGGTIDKFIGDAIMIFFGDPESRGDAEDAYACVAMAIEMRERMKSLQSAWYRQGISEPLEIRIGINTGYCTVGNFGSDDRLDYTVVGSQVNLATHLESQAKPNSILISQACYELIKDRVHCEAVKESTLENRNSSELHHYEVTGFLTENMSGRENILQQKTQGFLTNIDFQNLDEGEKAFVMSSIQNQL